MQSNSSFSIVYFSLKKSHCIKSFETDTLVWSDCFDLE